MPARLDAATLLRAVRALLAVAVLGFVGVRLWRDWRSTPWPTFAPAPLDLALAVCCAAGALLGLALLFAATLRRVGPYHPPHLPFYLRIWLQGYFWRYIPGKVMLLVERARLGEQVAIPRATSVGLVVWETLLLLAGAAVLSSAGLPLLGATGVQPATVLGGTALGLLAIVLLPALVRAVPPVRRRVPPGLLALGPGPLLGLVLGYALVWLLLGASFAFTVRCFPAGAAAGPEVALLYVLGYVAGLVLSVTPAGLGVREGLVVAGLSATFPATTGLAFALASRLLMTLVELVLVGLASRVEPAPR